MSRYIVVEKTEMGTKEERSFFWVYKKGWLFDSVLRIFLTKEEAISFVLNSIKMEGESKKDKIVFDSKKDLSMDIHF